MKPWWEREPELYERERSYWLRHGFREERSRGRPSFRGRITRRIGGPGVALARHSFELAVHYPLAYPHVPPEVEFIEPRIRRYRHQDPRSGAPCLFPPRAWAGQPAEQVEKAIGNWVRGYVLGAFARELAIYELPEYFLAGRTIVLAGADAIAAFDGRRHGRFRLALANGSDLAVLASVDGAKIGRELTNGLRLHVHETQPCPWFRLGAEPSAVRMTSELEALLAHEGHRFETERPPGEQRYVALLFEDTVDATPRLIVGDYSAPDKKTQRSARGWPVRGLNTYVVEPTALFLRLAGIRSADELGARHVVILGAGAIGSSVALTLAREAVGRFKICDPDVLRPGNVLRHGLDLHYVGQPKAEAVEAAIGAINPYADTSTETDNLTDPDVLATILRPDHPTSPCELAVVAIGDDRIDGLVSEVAALEPSGPLLFVRTVHDGDAIRIWLQRPGRGDACIECLHLHARDAHPALVRIPDSELPVVRDAGCATEALPGTGIASQQAALHAAKLTLALLERREPDANHWVHVERPIASAPDARLHSPGTHAAFIPSHPRCPVCGT